MTTGQRIRDLRKQQGLSAEDLAAKLGLSAATIYRYENGDIEKVRGDILEPLAKILHTTPAYLMGWEETAQASGDLPGAGESNVRPALCRKYKYRLLPDKFYPAGRSAVLCGL